MYELSNRHEWIKGALRERGVTFARIAQELGTTPSSVTHVSRGPTVSSRIQACIAGYLGVAPEELWPERYQAMMHGGRDMK